MLSERFNLLELTDLALQVPEKGAVNFNILHTVLCTIITELQLDRLRPACFIEDETLAQVAITKGRLDPSRARRPSRGEVQTIQQIKDKVRQLDGKSEASPSKKKSDDLKKAPQLESEQATQKKEEEASLEDKAEKDDIQEKSSESKEATGGDEDEKFKQDKETPKDPDEDGGKDEATEPEDEPHEKQKASISDDDEDVKKAEHEEEQPKVDDEEHEKEEIEEIRDEPEEKQEAVAEQQDGAETQELKDDADEGEDAVDEDEALEMMETKESGESEPEVVDDEDRQQELDEEEPKESSSSREVGLDKSQEQVEESEQRASSDRDAPEKDIKAEDLEKAETEDSPETAKTSDETRDEDDDAEKTLSTEKSVLPEEMTVEEMKDTVRDLLERETVPFVEEVEAVTEALQTLQDNDLLASEPAKVMEEVWRATNINRRMEAAETGLRELSNLIDGMLDTVSDMEKKSQESSDKTQEALEDLTKYLARIKELEEMCKGLGKKIEDVDGKRAYDVERLEGLINDEVMSHQETRTRLEQLEGSHEDLASKVAYKEDLQELKEDMSDALEAKAKELRKLVREVEDTLVRKDDFMEVITRIETLEETRVSRDELGRLLEPGFVDGFLEEQSNLRVELDELKTTVEDLRQEVDAINTRIDEEVLEKMHKQFSEVNKTIDTMKAKLDLLDPDEINDSFANLEDQAEMIVKEMGELKSAVEQFQTAAKLNANKISNVNELLNRLEQKKVDKARLQELLERKADIDLIAGKLDRGEFVAVVGEVTENLERVTIQVKINEEEMNSQFLRTRQELSLKMYTEDFIVATEPLRNRIRSILLELRRVEEIAREQLFPDAPGVVKCIACKRAANLAGPKYLGDESGDKLHPEKKLSSTSTSQKGGQESGKKSPGVKLPPIDLDVSVPIPPPDAPRHQDPSVLPVLFARARPQVGLAHAPLRRDIDKKLAAFFATRPVRPCEGAYTRTKPHQRGLDFCDLELPPEKKEEVLLESSDHRYFKGALYESDYEEPQDFPKIEDEKPTVKKPGTSDIASLKEPKGKKGFIKPVIKPRPKSEKIDAIKPSVVSLHVDNEPLQKPAPLNRSSLIIQLPCDILNKAARRASQP